MDVHASPAELPELKDFLVAFQGRFRRPEGGQALEPDMTGLLTELPNKNCDTMARAVPGTSEPRWQEFLNQYAMGCRGPQPPTGGQDDRGSQPARWRLGAG